MGCGCGSVGRAIASNFRVRGSNPVIGKILHRTLTINCIEKTKIKKKRPVFAHFLQKQLGNWLEALDPILTKLSYSTT